MSQRTIDWSNTIKINYFGGCIWSIRFCLDHDVLAKELKKEKRRRKFKKALENTWRIFYFCCCVIVLSNALSIFARWW